MKYCSINGIQQSSIELTDRGFSYGDGLFTTAKIVDGNVVFLSRHIDRLLKGCTQLHIAHPSQQHLIKQIQCVAKNYTLAVLKVIITSGSGGRGYSRIGLNENATNTIIIISDFPKHYKTQVQLGISLGDSKQRISISPMLSGLKHLNRLEQVLLRRELDERIEDDLVAINCHEHVVEATSANLFYWLNDQLCTPDLLMSGVNGIIRQIILELHPNVKICKTQREDLSQAKSMFICNSLMGIMPIKTYNNRQLAIDDVKRLQSQMEGLI